MSDIVTLFQTTKIS